MSATCSQALRIGQTFTHWTEVPTRTPPCVYMLVDSRQPNTPRYVGSTTDLRRRFQRHGNAAGAHDSAGAWKYAVVSSGASLCVRVVSVHVAEWACRSNEWRIAKRWRQRGVYLLGTHVPPHHDRIKAAAGRGWRGTLRVVLEAA